MAHDNNYGLENQTLKENWRTHNGFEHTCAYTKKNKKQKETKNLVDSCKLRFACLID